MSLFQLGEFELHSGNSSRWKIDCDALTDNDLEALAFMVQQMVSRFRHVVGVPRGGLRIAKALEKYSTLEGCSATLIVDDVLTTGASMEQYRVANSFGVVLFARGKCPDWVVPLFRTGWVK